MFRHLRNISFILLISSLGLQAQDRLSYGIKAGLNFSTITGEKESDTQGLVLEKGGFVTGFHVGAIFDIYILEDKFGVAPELLFSQKGGKYRYDGPGFLPIETTTGTLSTVGTRKDVISVVNSYINIPVMFYYKPLERLKVSAGFDLGFLIASSGNGETQFFWRDTNGENQVLTLEIDYNYYRDKAGEASSDDINTLTFNNNSSSIEYPTAIGAYFFESEKDGNFYNVFDLGLDLDVTVFVTKGISLGVRMNYGLLDVSNNNYDFSKVNPSISRSDSDKNLSFQAALAFNF